MNLYARYALIASILAGLSACAGVPPLKHVLLSPPVADRAPARPSDWQVSRVQVPEYLDSYDIQLRTNDFVLSRLANAKWAMRLPVAITQLLAQAIDEKLQTHRDQPYRVDVHIDAFEPQRSGRVVLAAHWTVTDSKTGDVVAHDNAVIQQPLPVAKRTPEKIGRAMSKAVRELGYRIVSAAG